MSMTHWTEQVALAEAEATRIEREETAAEQHFDAVHAAAERAGTLDAVTQTPEFDAWMAARRATDAAWGAWSLVMDARPAA